MNKPASQSRMKSLECSHTRASGQLTRYGTMLRARAAALLVATAVACGGSSDIDDNSGIPGGQDPGAKAGASDGSAAGGAGAGGMTGPEWESIGLRRLTKIEYENVIFDAFGVAGAASGLFGENQVGFLSNNARALRVGGPGLQAYETTAERIAPLILAKLTLPCTVDKMTSACIRTLLPDLLSKLYRRPASADEQTRLVTLFEKIIALDGATLATASVLEAALLSPSFLYRWEVGGGESANLTAYEMANRLSFLIWVSAPDATLLKAAAENRLTTPEDIAVQAKRMLADTKAKRAVVDFFFQWLGLYEAKVAKKGTSVTANLPATAQSDMIAETTQYITDAVLGSSGMVDGVWNGKQSFMNASIASIYGITGVTGTEMRKVDIGSKRHGLLTQPLVLTAHTKEDGYSVVQIGRFVRERLLCQTIQPAPPGASTKIDDSKLDPNLTYREKLAAHATGTCAGCHQIMDPPGFAFLPFDPIGRFKANDPKGVPFDTKGTLVDIDGKSVPFSDAKGMLEIIGKSDDLRRCFTKKYMEYTLGRALGPGDAPLQEKMLETYQSTTGKFSELVRELTSSATFAKHSSKP